MKNIVQNTNEEFYFGFIEGKKTKFKLNKITNKRSFYIKNLDSISGLYQEIDDFKPSENWIEFDNQEDCVYKAKRCVLTMLLHMLGILKKDIESKRNKRKYVNNNKTT